MPIIITSLLLGLLSYNDIMSVFLNVGGWGGEGMIISLFKKKVIKKILVIIEASCYCKGVISGPASPAIARPIIRPVLVRAIFKWLIDSY